MIRRMKPIRAADRWAQLRRGRVAARFQGIKAPRSARFLGSPIVDICPGSSIDLGENVTITSHPRMHLNGCPHPTMLSTRQQESRILIGDDSAVSGSSLIARADILIGDRVMISAGCQLYAGHVHDTHTVPRRYLPATRRDTADTIVIEDEVFIGRNVTVMAGVTIGAGSVVGAQSVVTRDVPPMTIVAGAPAREIGRVDPSKGHLAAKSPD